MNKLLRLLGDEVTEPEEESFLVFSAPIPSQNLGFVDAKSSTLELNIAGKDISIRQSPTLLSSNRKEGTTGAVVWKITPLFAEWISNSDNVLFQSSLLHRDAIILELGCGISGIIGLVLASRIRRYIATDQDYVLKFLRENIKENEPVFKMSTHKSLKKSARKEAKADDAILNIDTRSLDWETDSFSSLYNDLGIRSSTETSSGGSIDMLIACDCIYNSHLIAPLTTAMAEICQLAPASKPTLCVVAQQLRSPDVFEEWLTAFHEKFRVWRVPDELLIDGLKEGSGFILHLGLVRE